MKEKEDEVRTMWRLGEGLVFGKWMVLNSYVSITI